VTRKEIAMLRILYPALLTASLFATSCGGETLRTGTLVFTANGEDFVRDGFVSEDGWRIDFSGVWVNVYGPTAYQVVEERSLRHGGHPHEDIPEGAAHVSLLGDFFLALKAPTFEVGREAQAPIGNYNRLAFTVRPAVPESAGLVADHLGHSIVLAGTATRAGEQDVTFRLRFDEELAYSACGPNGLAGVLAEGGQASAEMTFHFDHVFGDFDEGPADPEDPETVNHLAIGFGPFAALAAGGVLEMDQAELGEVMTGAVFLQLVEAVRTLGHSGEAHCHLD